MIIAIAAMIQMRIWTSAAMGSQQAPRGTPIIVPIKRLRVRSIVPVNEFVTV